MNTAAMLPVDDGGRVHVDLPCVGCHYNLRGLLIEGDCPECGEVIEKSALLWRRTGLSASRIAALRTAFFWWAFIGAGLMAAGVGAGFAMVSGGEAVAFVAGGIAMWVIFLSALIGCLVGGRSDRGEAGGEPMRGLRRSGVMLLQAALVAGPTAAALAMVGTMFGIALAVLAAAMVVLGFGVSLLYLTSVLEMVPAMRPMLREADVVVGDVLLYAVPILLVLAMLAPQGAALAAALVLGATGVWVASFTLRARRALPTGVE